jgi:hypothetical protein
VYGLTDPAIFDESQLPKTLDEAAKRYCLAIKTIQAQGPYALSGFSFGATLAWKVAEKLVAEGETISQLHLLDGFPPYLYQQLDKAGHAYLFKSLIRFILNMLNNKYYNQGLTPTNYQGLEDLTPLQQVEVVFKHLLSELNPKKPRYEEAKCLLALAKQHLSFMRLEKLSDTNLPFYPKLYLTDQTQPYLAVIESIPTLSRHSADHRYFYWNYYFKQLRRNGTDLIVQHNELLSNEKSNEARHYFQFQHVLMFNYDFDHYYFDFSYHLDKNKLSLLFLRPHQVKYYNQRLTALGLTLDVLILHKNTYNNYHRQHDSLYFQLACIIAYVEDEKISKVKELLGEPIPNEYLVSTSNVLPQLTPGHKPLRIHLIIRCANFTVYSIDLLVYVDHLPKISKGDFFFSAKNDNALYYPNIIPNLEKESLQSAQQWLIQALLSLGPCCIKPQFAKTTATSSLLMN